MEAATLLALVGALIGAAFGAGWYAVDVLLDTATITDAKFGACVILGGLLTPVISFVIYAISEW